jgi:hypothetical protein
METLEKVLDLEAFLPSHLPLLSPCDADAVCVSIVGSDENLVGGALGFVDEDDAHVRRFS